MSNIEDIMRNEIDNTYEYEYVSITFYFQV